MENNEILDSGVLDQTNSKTEIYEYASTGKRFANYIIDRIVLLILIFICGMLYAIAFPFSGEMSTLTSYLIGYSVLILYYTILESTTGKTIGKMITGTRVLNDDNSSPSFGTIFKRSLCRIIPFEAFSFLGGNNGWHDTLTYTQVVND
jgi:uncharacterized RDD family membrane protein YckC